MLSLTRNVGQEILVGAGDHEIKIRVTGFRISPDGVVSVRLAFDAEYDVIIDRAEKFNEEEGA